MCTFDSPIARCEVMRTMVLTDQTQAQCARENACPAETDCPLRSCFSGVEWVDAPEPVALAAPAARRRKVPLAA